MPKRIAQDWEGLERSLHAAGVSPEEIDSGARALLAQARGHLAAEARKALTRARGNYSRGPFSRWWYRWHFRPRP